MLDIARLLDRHDVAGEIVAQPVIDRRGDDEAVERTASGTSGSGLGLRSIRKTLLVRV
jgi:hypothetical protein